MFSGGAKENHILYLSNRGSTPTPLAGESSLHEVPSNMPPPLANKSKGKGREVRRSRSRNTTPSSVSTNTVTGISYLDNDISKMLVSTSVQYSDILDKLGGSGQIPEQKALESLVEHLKTLSQFAEARGEACNAGIREISQKRKDALEELREREQFDRDAEERLRMKREADDDEDMGRSSKGGKLKKRKDRGTVKEERPLSHGAHGVAKQDGTDLKTDSKHAISHILTATVLYFVSLLVAVSSNNPVCLHSPLSHLKDFYILFFGLLF